LNFFYKVRQELGFPAKLHAPISRFGNSVHLPFPPDVILELGNQRKNAHDELPGARSRVDSGIIGDFKGHLLLRQLRNDAIKI
jgi:hypothetical protein